MSEKKYQFEDLRKWFGKGPKGDWVRVGTDGDIKGDCAREPGEGKPKCMPRDKAHSMSKKDRGASARRKRRADPDVDRPGTGNKPIMVKTDKEDKKKKTNEATVKVDMGKFKSMAKSIATGKIEKDSNKKVMGYLRAMGKKIRLERDPNSTSGFKVVIEKNVPTNPKLWSKFKSQAKSKFDVYPSAYANGWAAKQYKAAGGGWKTEDVDEALAPPAKPVTDKEIKRRQNISKTKNAPKKSFKSMRNRLGESDYTPATKSTDVGGKPLLRKQVKKAIDKKNIAKQNAMTRKYNKMHRESVELDENYRTLAMHGMGTERKQDARVGLEMDYYDNTGSKRMGKITKVTSTGYVVRDDKDGKSRSFVFHDRVKAKDLLAKHGKGKYKESYV